MNMKKVIFLVTIVLLLAAFGVSAFMVGSYLLDGKEQEERNDELAQMVEDARNNAATKATEAEKTEESVPADSTEETTEATEPEVLEP